jgi:prepilin-type N-terminal cleavage/methylation domain-containing protein
MTPRRGFTLLEVMVALVVTGIVALLAYGAASAGFDASDRLERYRATVEAQAIVRALLLDALRHLPEGGGAAMNDTLFALHDRASAEGIPSDALRFFSRGVTPPLGASGSWMVTLAPAEEGVRMVAVPIGPGEAAPVSVRLSGARGLDVRLLDRTADSLWLDRWDVAGRVPAAVALEFLSAGGVPVGPPLVVHAALEVVR